MRDGTGLDLGPLLELCTDLRYVNRADSRRAFGLSPRVAMSALGQKQTCAVQKGMSALPPIATAKADIRSLPARWQL
jgi:hypothetical protein